MKFLCLGLQIPWDCHKFSTPFINIEQSKEEMIYNIFLYTVLNYLKQQLPPFLSSLAGKKNAAASGLSAITVLYTMIGRLLSKITEGKIRQNYINSALKNIPNIA